MKYFVFSDVHSFYDELMFALANAGFNIDNENHGIISLGDLLDRGDKTVECLKFINSIPKERKILIRGNHEDLIERCLNFGSFTSIDYHNGTANSVMALAGYNAVTADEIFKNARENEDLKTYLADCINYYEKDNNIFVHGWIPVIVTEKFSGETYEYDKNWRDRTDYFWKEARWLNGMNMWRDGIKEDGKTIWCGHWHASYGHSIIDNKCSEFGKDAIFDPYEKDGICAMDTCTALTYRVNVKTIEL